MESEIFSAIEEQCSIEELQKIKAKVENINMKNNFGETALAAVISLCFYGRPRKGVDSKDFESYILKAVKLLIEAGVDVDSQDHDGFTALHRAVQIQNKEVVECLIDARSDVNLKNKYGQTVLHVAVIKNQVDIIQLLLQRNGIDVDSQDREGFTALHFAVQKKNKEVVACLIDAGSDANLKNDDGKTALHLAADNYDNTVDILRLLIQRVIVDSKDYYGFTALHLAAKKQNKEVIECLIDAGADVNSKNKIGQSVIQALISINHKQKEKFFEILEKLIKAGADIDSMNKYGSTALHIAADNSYPNQVEFIRFLLQRDGVDIDLRDREGMTALHRAILKENKDAIQCLIDAGADVNRKTSDGYTALHLAAETLNVDLIKYLITQGVDVNAKNSRTGETPLHVVMYASDQVLAGKELLLAQADALEVLLSANAEVNAVEISHDGTPVLSFVDSQYDIINTTPIDLETTESFFKILKIFIKYRADFKIKNLDGKTPLVIFLQNCLRYENSNFPIIVLDIFIKYHLIDVESLFTPRLPYGETILDNSCLSLYYKLIKFLVNYGANINLKDHFGETPLFKLTKSFLNGYGTRHEFKILDYFLSLNPEFNVITSYGLHILNLDIDFISYPEFLWKALVEYIAKKQSTGYFLNEDIALTISQDTYYGYQSHLDKCTEELKSLQKLKFPWVTLSNILTDHKERIVRYAKNKNLAKEFNELLLAEKYPIYGPSIVKKFSKALLKQEIMDKSAIILSSCLPCLLDPSHIVIWKIISYLKGKHLRYLCEPESEVLKIKIKMDELKVSFDKYFCSCYEIE